VIRHYGIIRYKVVGFESNEEKLFDEMNTMIESIKLSQGGFEKMYKKNIRGIKIFLKK